MKLLDLLTNKKKKIARKMNDESFLDVDAMSNKKFNAGVSSRNISSSEAMRLAESMNRMGWTYKQIIDELLRKGISRQVAESAAAPFS